MARAGHATDHRHLRAAPATIATYSVAHGRDGGPEWGVAVLDLPDGIRSYGRFDDPATLAALERDEYVGRPVTSTPDGPVNRLAL